MKYVIKGMLADLNKHDNANRANKFGGARLKKEQTDLVAWQLKGKPKIDNPCELEFTWYYSGKFDFDNIRFAAKYIQDGMVKAGVLKDDSQKYVIGYQGDHFQKVDKGSEKVIVEVYEYPE